MTLLQLTDANVVAAMVSSIPKLITSVRRLPKLRVDDYGDAGIAKGVVSDCNWRCHVDEVDMQSQAAAPGTKQQGRSFLEMVCWRVLRSLTE